MTMVSTWSILVVAAAAIFFLYTLPAAILARTRMKRYVEKAFHYEFYIASGTLMWVTMAFTYMAAYMEAWEFVGMPAVFVSEGFEWWFIEMLFYLTWVPLWLLVSLRIWRPSKIHRYVTPTDIIVHRAGGYEAPLRIILAIIIFYATILYIGMIYIPTAGVLTAVTGGEISYHTFLIIITIMLLANIFIGGFRAVAYTDVIAGVTFLIAFGVMIYFAVAHYGGFGQLIDTAYNTELAKKIFTITLPPQYFLTMLLLYGPSWLFIPHLITKIYAAKDYKSVVLGGLFSKIGFLVGAFLSPIMIASAFLAQYGNLPELPSVTVVEEYPARLFFDWLGPSILMYIIVLGLIAISRTTIDAMILLGASLIDWDILQKALKLKISPRARGWITTGLILLTAALAILVALNPEHPMVIIGFEFTFPAYAVIAFPAIIALFIDRVNKYGLFWGYLTGFASLILFTYVIWPEAPHNPFGVWEGTLPSAIASIVTLVVSYLTPPPPKEHLEEFWGIKKELEIIQKA
jgi:Na+/proline symporter